MHVTPSPSTEPRPPSPGAANDAAHDLRRAGQRRVVTSIATVQLLAIAVWAGGLLALGAIVAPIVFRIVPAPTSADAMTLVFRRFDGVAIACAALALVAEAMLALRGGRVTRLDLVRGTALVSAAGCAIAIGAWLSPAISQLHQDGAVRGLGPAGLALDHFHKLAETIAKIELGLLFVGFALGVARASRPPS